MNVPYFVKVLIIVAGWIIGVVGFYLSWVYPVVTPNVVISMCAGLLGVLFYSMAIFTTLAILNRIDL